MSLFENDPQEERDEQSHDEIDGNRLSEKTRASIWLILSVAVFMCAIIMCLSLISRSADPVQTEQVSIHFANIEHENAESATAPGINYGEIYYELNPLQSEQESSEEQEESQNDAPSSEDSAPVSVNQSDKFNYLLAAIDRETEQTDMLIILNIDTVDITVSLLSVPRDTYIFGSYDIPKVNRIFGDNGDFGAGALFEATENMLGFPLDGYLLFDAQALETLMDSTGSIEFDVPKEPDYHTLRSGKQTLDGAEAFELLRYHEDYTDVETEPCQVQRDFMLTLLQLLLDDQERLEEHANLICETALTNINEETLVYFGQMLQDFDASEAYEAALPGGEIKVDGERFYQVNIEKACDRLNEHFNPLDEELTEFSVHFRQKHDDNGIGEDPDWTPDNSTEPKTENEVEPIEPNESTEDETEESEPTEESTEETTQEPTEETTEEITEEPTETPSETEELPELPEPTEPSEPGGDE